MYNLLILIDIIRLLFIGKTQKEIIVLPTELSVLKTFHGLFELKCFALFLWAVYSQNLFTL